MTHPPVDSTPILIIAFSAILFVVVLLLIYWVLDSITEPMEEFEPYAGEYDGEEDYTFPVSDEKMEGFIKDRLALVESDKTQTESDLEYFDLDRIGWLKRHATPSYADQPDWKRAFRLYNRHHETVSMLCSPCYFKVLQYIIKLKNEKTNNEKNGNPGC